MIENNLIVTRVALSLTWWFNEEATLDINAYMPDLCRCCMYRLVHSYQFALATLYHNCTDHRNLKDYDCDTEPKEL